MSEAENPRLIPVGDFTQRVKDLRPSDVSEQDFLATAQMLRGLLNQLLVEESISYDDYDKRIELLIGKYIWLTRKHGATTSDVLQAINLTAQGKAPQFPRVHSSFNS